jgi:hypothetical protein
VSIKKRISRGQRAIANYELLEKIILSFSLTQWEDEEEREEKNHT